MKIYIYRNCKKCDIEFALKKDSDPKIFCSLNCANKMKPRKVSAKIEKECLECGIKYFVFKSRENTSFYCSTKCQQNGRLKRSWKNKSITKKCLICENIFKTYFSQNKTSCSKECSNILKKKNSFLKFKTYCATCGQEFLPPRMSEGGIFCSYKCSGIAARKERVNRNGYWYLYKPEHPDSSKNGYIAEHRFIMEIHLGRRINDNECVHHKDHNKKNNDISNLEIMLNSDHSKYHSEKMWETRCKDALANEMLGNHNGKRRNNK